MSIQRAALYSMAQGGEGGGGGGGGGVANVVTSVAQKYVVFDTQHKKKPVKTGLRKKVTVLFVLQQQHRHPPKKTPQKSCRNSRKQ